MARRSGHNNNNVKLMLPILLLAAGAQGFVNSGVRSGRGLVRMYVLHRVLV